MIGDPPLANTGNNYQCLTCGQWVMYGAAHSCIPVQIPGVNVLPTPGCRAPWMPLTIDAIRLVIREELERAGVGKDGGR